MSKACFKISDLSLGYGEKVIVDGLSLEIEKGKITALLGANGCGKSTILKGLTGQLKPMQGTVLLGDLPVGNMTAKAIAKQIAVLSQHAEKPLGLNVGQLVKMGRYPYLSLFDRWSDVDEIACNEALELTAMDKLKEQPLDALSGGQLQRAWISLALAQQTEVLLLDEPTTFLDLAHQLEIMDLMKKLVRQNDKTIIAVLHDLNQAARYADHIVLLKDGRLIAQGEPAKVITPANVKKTYGVAVSKITDPKSGKTYFDTSLSE